MPPLTPATPVFYYGLLIGCLVLGGGLAALAWRRPHRRQRGPRALAGLVAAMALWFIAFPPLHRLPSAKAEAILLTDGYQLDTLRQLLRRVGAGTPVWFYGTTTAPAKARALASLLNLAEQRPALRRVHILGKGLPADELPLLANLTVKYHPGAPFSGFKSAFWNSKVVLSERLQVEGTMALPKSEGAAWVCLRAAGAVRDSVAVSAGGGPFRLGYQPKTAGLALGQLLLRRAGKMLAAEPVPFEVTTLALPAVLLLTAIPSFEFKYLKNHLAEAHYPVALRTTVSRGLVQTDFVNQPAVGLGRLTPALLARYSVLIVDAATLAAFAPAEAQALQAALGAGRLGVVVVADAAPLPRNAPARADFAVQPRSAAQSVPNLLVWTDAPGGARAALPAQLAPAPNLRALVTGPGGALAVARRRVGLGFAVVSVIPETFHWGLQGQSEVYASFWNRLLTAAVPAAAASAWQVGTRWARPGRSLSLRYEGRLPDELPVVGLFNNPSVRLPLLQDTRLPEWNTAQFWPAASGWHQVRGPGQIAHSFYVFPPSAWLGLELRERLQAAELRKESANASAASGVDTVQQPWSPVWFFALFLLAACYLWLEEKL